MKRGATLAELERRGFIGWRLEWHELGCMLREWEVDSKREATDVPFWLRESFYLFTWTYILYLGFSQMTGGRLEYENVIRNLYLEGEEQDMPFSDHAIDLEVTKKSEIGYRLFTPNQYDPNQSWPLFLFLHGMNKRGEDLSLLDNYGLLKHAGINQDFPYFIVAPQCPSFTHWPSIRHEVIGLLFQVISSYNINKKQVYVTGFSMGGNGTWDIAVHSPEFFAAAVPISAWYEKESAPYINIPVWAFHGAEDDVVNVSGSIDMVDGMKASGKEVLFTSYPGLKHGHEVMEKTFSNPELYDWLKQASSRRKQ